MALSLGILQTSLVKPTGTVKSLCSIAGSKTWQSKSFTQTGAVRTRRLLDSNRNDASVESLLSPYGVDSVFVSRRSRVRSNASGRSSQQALTSDLDWSLLIEEASAQSVAADEELSREESANYLQMEDGVAPAATPQQSTGRLRQRLPDETSGRDATVPAVAVRRGAVFKGTVSSIQSYGAFVNFGAYADGLVHISKLSTGFVRDVGDIVSLGQEVTVTVINVEQSSGRISLSMVEEDERGSSRPHVPSTNLASREGGNRPRFQAGSGRSALPIVEKEERISRIPYASPRREESREAGQRPRLQPGFGTIAYSMTHQQERVSNIPNTSSRQGETRGGERPRSQPGSDRRQFSMVNNDDSTASNQHVSFRQGDAGGGERPRFQPGSGRRAFSMGEKEQTIASQYVSSSRQGVAGGGDNPRFRQGNDGKFLNRKRITRVGSGINRVEEKPKMKLVQIQDAEVVDSTTAEEKRRSRMRSWYDCDCCY